MINELIYPRDAQFARVEQNEQMISVESLSGYRMLLPEDDAMAFFELDVPDELFGVALIDALSRSRLVVPNEEPGFFELYRYQRLADSRTKQVIKRSKFRSYKRTYENMRYVDLERYSGNIMIVPHRRKSGKFWESLRDDLTVVIPAESSAEEIGAAARLGLSRCPPMP